MGDETEVRVVDNDGTEHRFRFRNEESAKKAAELLEAQTHIKAAYVIPPVLRHGRAL